MKIQDYINSGFTVLNNENIWTLQKYENLWNNQNGLCKICESELSEGAHKPHVDHDHNTGEVRGILCANCNRGLGAFKDDKILLLKAIDYLGEV